MATYSAGTVSLTVVPDMRGFTQKLRAGLASVRDETVKLKVDVDEQSLNRFRDRISGMRDERIRVKADVDSSGLTDLTSKAAGAAGAVALIGSAASGAGTVLAGLPSLLASISGIGGVVALSFKGAGDALSAYQSDQDNAGAVASRTALREANSARSIRQALVGVSDARKQSAQTAQQGAEQIESAERRVSDAVTAESRAQENVTRARKEATQAAEDLRFRVQDLALDQEAAAIRLKEAEDTYKIVSQAAGATDLDRRKALLDLNQARLSSTEIQVDQNRATAELVGIEKNGIDSTDQVQTALRGQADAAKSTNEAQIALGQTERQVAQANADSAEQVSKALQAVADAKSQASEASAVASQTDTEFGDAMAKLTPKAQALVNQLISMKPAIDKLKIAAGDQFLPGVTSMLKDSLVLLPIFQGYFAKTSAILGDAASRMGQLFKNEDFRNNLQVLLNSGLPITRAISDAIVNLTRDFVGFGASMSGVGEGVAAAISGASDGISKFFTSLKPFAADFQSIWGSVGYILSNLLPAVGTSMGQVAHIFAPLLVAVGDFLSFAGPAVAVLLTTITTAAIALKGLALTQAIGGFVAGIGGAAVEGTRFAGVMGRIGNTLPIVGAVLIGLGIAYDSLRDKSASAAQQVTAGSLSMTDAIQKQFSALVQQQTLWSNSLGGIPALLGQTRSASELWAQAQSDVNAQLQIQLAAMDPVKRATAEVAIAQDHYNQVLHDNPPNSAAAGAAQDALASAVQRQKSAQDQAAESTKTATDRIKEQQDAILGALDSNIAYQQSQIRVAQAHDTTRDALVKYGAQSVQYHSAVLDEQQAILSASSAAGRYAGDQAKAKGATNDTEVATQAQKEEFQRLVATSNGPVHAALTGVANDLKNIPLITNMKVAANGTYTLGDGTTGGGARNSAPGFVSGHAAGGILPGYTPGRDVHTFTGAAGTLNLSGGEAIMRPEFTRAVGAGFINSMNATAANRGTAGVRQALGVRGFAVGGIYDTAALDGMVTPDMTTDIYKALAAKTATTLQASIASVGAGAGAGVTRWAPVVLQALAMMSQPAGLLGSVLSRMQRESGGNPTIANLWDINAQRGTPSVGLMQVIGPTYRANADPRHNVGPYEYGTSVDPLSNILASMHYAIGRYGSLSAAYNKAGGYDSGGWLPPGATMAVNKTGVPEAILTGRQWDSVQALASQGAASNGPAAVIHVYAREGQDTGAVARDVKRQFDFANRTG